MRDNILDTTQSKKKCISLQELYLLYKYKKKPDVDYVSLPYFPDSEITNTVNSFTYKEWKLIVTTYYKYLKEYLLQGNEYKCPDRMGMLYMKKYKAPNIVKKVHYKNKIDNFHSNNYRVLIKWDRKGFPISYPEMWKIAPTATFDRDIYKKLTNEISNINNIIK